jgi:hypothetical protein
VVAKGEGSGTVTSGKHITLEQLCCCTQTYARFSDQINPWPQQSESLTALQELCECILDPIVDHFGLENFCLTYGFCSRDLRKFLNRRDPLTGKKYGRIDTCRDQHMAHERNRNGKLYCERLGAAADFYIQGIGSSKVIDWILAQQLPFDSIYFYGSDRPIHISYGPQHKRSIWTFTESGQPTQKGIEEWVKLARLIP